MNVKLIITVLCLLGLQACSSIPQQQTLQPEHVQALYEKPQPGYVAPELVAGEAGDISRLATQQVVVASDNAAAVREGTCDAVSSEIAFLNEGLGSSAADQPPTVPPTAGQKTGNYFYNLGVQTVLGQLQLFIQTKRAIFDDDETDRRLAESKERGTTRRAYLMGYADASGCDAQDGTDITSTAMQLPSVEHEKDPS